MIVIHLLKIRIYQVTLAVSVAVVVPLLYYMNVKGIEYIEDNSTPLGSFVNATEWLSLNLKPGDVVIVPHALVFHSLNPKLKDQFLDYKVVWDKAKVFWRANTTEDEVSKVRTILEANILYAPHLKYLVVDWFYPYSTKLFINHSCSDFGDLLQEVKRFEFKLPHFNWKNKLSICEVNRSK